MRIFLFSILFTCLYCVVLCLSDKCGEDFPQDPGQAEEVQSESLGWTGQKLETKDSQVCTLFCFNSVLAAH